MSWTFMKGTALILFALATIAYWLWRRQRESRAFTQALMAARMLMHAESVQLFLKAEAAWTFNLFHNTPKTAINSLDRLRRIVVQLATQARHIGVQVDSDSLLAVIGELQGKYANKANHQWGSHGTALTAAAMQEIDLLHEKLDQERNLLRSQLQTKNLKGRRPILFGAEHGTGVNQVISPSYHFLAYFLARQNEAFTAETASIGTHGRTKAFASGTSTE